MTGNENYNYTTLADIKHAARQSVLKRWQCRWDLSDHGRHLYEIVPTISTNVTLDRPSKHHGTILSQLRTGYCHLNKYKFQLGQAETPICDCGKEEETPTHFLLHCTKYDMERTEMFSTLYQMFGITKPELTFLLGRHPNSEVLALLATFLDKTGRFQAINA